MVSRVHLNHEVLGSISHGHQFCCKKYNLHRTKPVNYLNVHMNASSVVVSDAYATPVAMGSTPGSSVFSLDFLWAFDPCLAVMVVMLVIYYGV